MAKKASNKVAANETKAMQEKQAINQKLSKEPSNKQKIIT
jgi:hypothetical protein